MVDECAGAVLTHLPAVMWYVRRHMRSGRAKGLSVPQFRVLVRVERQATLSDVASCLGTTLPTTSRIVSGLVAKGYLERAESAEDRRCRCLTLTPCGQRILRDAYDVTRRAMAVELERLTAAQCRTIAEGISLLGDIFSDGKSR